MFIGGYKIRNHWQKHFITFSVVDWIDVFTRKQYCEIFLNSVKFCQTHKGLMINAWCLMSNHVHMIASAKNENLSCILRDLKKFTSVEITQAILNNPKESRKYWMLKLFADHGEKNSRNKIYQFWQQDNHPKELSSSKFTHQKLLYIHHNPVKAGIVRKPEDYVYSSAMNYKLREPTGILNVDLL